MVEGRDAAAQAAQAAASREARAESLLDALEQQQVKGQELPLPLPYPYPSEDALKPRGMMGGAVNALGRLLMTNTALRGHRAINGGALYTEGVVRIERSVMTLNSCLVSF